MAKTIEKTIFASLPLEQHENTFTWRQRGGLAGGKILSNIQARAEKAGFKQVDRSLTGTPDGSHMGGGDTYQGPNGWWLFTTATYGETKDKNRFSAILSPSK